MNTFNISLNKELVDLVNQQVKKGKFANRSEFFRQLLRFVFLKEKSKVNDWIYEEPYKSELLKRIRSEESGDDKNYISLQDFDKEFNL